MTAELYQALLVIGIIAVGCALLSPILWFILFDRSESA